MAEERSTMPALRAEHDALAQRLAVRGSVDVLRRAVVLGFFGLMAAGLSWATLWDRYGKTPTEFALQHTLLFQVAWVVSGLAALTSFVLVGMTLARWRRVARDEEQLFARLCELRRTLGIDP